MLKKTFKKIGTFFLYPFSENLLFFIAFFIFATSPYFLWFIIYDKYYYSLNLIMHCLVISYLVTFMFSLIPHNATRRIINGIVIGISAIFFGLNIYGIFELDSLVDEDHIMLILDTNLTEAKEFLSSLLPAHLLFGVALVYITIVTLWIISKRHPIKLGIKSSRIAVICICICTIKSLLGWGIWVDGPIKHLSDLFTSLKKYDIIAESDLHHTLPTITFADGQQMPANVVLIIGESFARFHSSLYGYEKPTNPYMSALREQSLLFTFDRIDAPAPTTSQSIQFMLSTCSKSNLKNKKWYDYPSIIELMKKCGYNCYWFSNQARTGKFNYAARIFAQSCDQCFFYQQEGSIRINTNHDMVLVDSSYQFINNLDHRKHNFIIYHMMGSHFDYSMRYPKKFSCFSIEDYSKYPQHQRYILATYDNSILYNDYVINNIINIFKEDNAIIIYAPDHGQDMFRSSPYYRAHGKSNNPVSYAYGVEIPFIIYATPLFQKNNPVTIRRIKNRQQNPKYWVTDNLPYLIMDLIGVKTIDGDSIDEKSILN